MPLATLSIDLVAQLASLQTGMDKAARIAERSAAQIERKFAGLSKAAGAITAAFGTALAGAGLTAFFRNAVDGIDKLNDLADATGASVENLSALEDAARRTGTGVDVVGDALVKLNKTLSDAKPGSEQAAALKAIGLSAADLTKLDPAEALLRVAQALSQFEDDGNKARIVQELFGKSIKDVAPLLKDLVEQGTLNAKVTREQAEEAEKFKRQTAELDKSLTDMARTLALAVLPALNDVLKALKEGGIGAAFDKFGDVAFDWSNNQARKELKRLEADLASLKSQPPVSGGFVDFLFGRSQTAIDEEVVKLETRIASLKEKLRASVGEDVAPRDVLRGIEARSATRSSAPLPKDGTPKPGPRASEFGPFDIDIPPALREAFKLIEQADERKLADLRAQLAELVRLVSEGGAVPDSVFAKMAEDIAKLDPAAQKAAEAAEELKKLREAGQQVFEQTRTPAEALARELDKLNKLLQAGAIDWDTYSRAVFAAQDAFDASLKPAIAEVSEFAKEASRNIQDALGESILASMEGNASSIEDIWKRMIKRMVAEAAAAKLAESLLGKGYGTTTGEVGGWIGQAITWLGNNWGGQGARGGPMQAGKAYLVGEEGPEVVVPGQSATVIPNGAMGKGGVSVYSPIIVQGDVAPKTARLLRSAMAQTEARIANAGRY